MPGDRFLVDWGPHDPGYSHERILGSLLFADSAIVWTPGGHRYVENADDWLRVWKLTGSERYPTDAPPEVVHFELPLTTGEMLTLIRRSQVEAQAEQRANRTKTAVKQPSHGVDWEGKPLSLSVVGGGVLRRLTAKRPEGAPRPVDAREAAGVGGEAGVPTPRGDTIDAGPGCVWLVSGGSALALGMEVDLHDPAVTKACAVGDHGLFKHVSGKTVPVERVAMCDVPDFVAKKRAEFYVRSGRGPEAPRAAEAAAPRVDAGPDAGVGAEPAAGTHDGSALDAGDLRRRLRGADDSAAAAVDHVKEEDQDDCRTLWVDTDTHGLRRKTWENILNESYHAPFSEHTHIRGPATVHSTLRYMCENGGDPRRWFDEFKRVKRIEANDRVVWEMRPLVECFYYAGSVDQLNMPALASFEILSRRLLGIIDAYAGDGQKPNWKIAGHISGGVGLDDAMSLEMRNYVQRTVKERNDLEVARRRADGGAHDGGDDNFGGGSSSADATPGGKAGGKGPGRGRRPTLPAPKK